MDIGSPTYQYRFVGVGHVSDGDLSLPKQKRVVLYDVLVPVNPSVGELVSWRGKLAMCTVHLKVRSRPSLSRTTHEDLSPG